MTVLVDAPTIRLTLGGPRGPVGPPGPPGGIGEAPNDGTEYVRKNAAWAPATSSAGGIADAPNNANEYVRKGAAWVQLIRSATNITFAPAGDVAATNVQAAIVELDTEKVAKVPSTDNALARFDGTGGVIQSSNVTLSDAGVLTAPSVRVDDAPYDAAWNGDLSVPTKNAIFDKIEALGGIASPQASSVIFTPAGNVTATNVQAAIAELDTEKVAKITSVDNSVTRFDGTGGAVQTSPMIISDAGGVSGVASLTLNANTAYGAGWASDLSVPTKKALYDKIETLGAGGGGNVTANFTGATSRTVSDLLQYEVDFRSTGATANNDAADEAKVATLVSNIIPGQVIRGTRGGGAVAAIKLANTLEFRRQPHLDLEPGFDIRLDKASGTANAVELNVDYTRAEFDVAGAPTATGDYRMTSLKGGRITINGAAVGYALAINKAGSGHKNGVLIEVADMSLSAGNAANLGALLIDSSRTSVNVADKETQWLVVRRCDMDGGVTVNAEDGTVFHNSLSHGLRGTSWSKTFGAFNWGWHGGAIVNSQWNIDIADGSFGQFNNVQVERSGSGTTEFMVRVRGLNFPAQGISFRSDNFGGGVGLQNAIVLERARRTLIDNCQFGNFENADLTLHVDTGATSLDTSGTILLPNQVFRGARAMRGLATASVKTDLTRRMAIKTTSNRKIRTQQFNQWHPGFEQLTTAAGGPGSGVVDADLEFMLTEHGIVWWNGGIRKPTASGGLTAATVLGRIPFFLWPHTSRYIPVNTRTRTGVAWLIVSRNSDGTENTGDANRGLLELQNDFSTEEYLYFGSWPAVLEPDYVTVS